MLLFQQRNDLPPESKNSKENIRAVLIYKFFNNYFVKATPHRDCGVDTQSDFSADCAEILQAY